MKSDSFLLQADKNHFIDKDLSKGIQWGSLFKVNSAGFHLGDNSQTGGKYKSCFISGNENGISFNFSDGKYVTFTSKTGITTTDNNVTI
jgi:hypothetical protein